MSIDTEVQTQLHEHYSEPHNILFEDGKTTSPVLAMAEGRKMVEGMGRGYVIPITTYEGSAVGADAAVADDILEDEDTGAQALADRWVVSAVSLDAPFSFQRDELLAIEGAKKSEQFDVLQRRYELAAKRIRNQLALQCVEAGWGYIGTITAITSSTITLPVSVVSNRVQVGDQFVASASMSTDVLLGSPAGARLRATAVNEATGVVTLSGDPTSVWTNSATLRIFRAGMRIATDPSDAESAKISLTGLLGWINPSKTTQWGVTCTGNPALCGNDVDTSGLDTEFGLIRLVNRLVAKSRPVDTVVVGPTSWELLVRDTDAAKVVEIKLGEYNIGFSAFKLPTAAGVTMVVQEPKMPNGTAIAGPFQSKTHGPYLAYSGKQIVNLEDFDGADFRRTHTGGSRKYRGGFFYRGNYIIPGPGNFAITDDLPTS